MTDIMRTPTIVEEPKRELTPARKAYLENLLEQEGELIDEMQAIQTELDKLIKQNQRSGVLVNERSVNQKSNKIIDSHIAAMIGIIVLYNQKTGEVVTEYEKSRLASEFDSNKKIAFMANLLQSEIVADLKKVASRKFTVDGISIGARIKTIGESYKKTISDIIAVGIKDGLSAFQIAEKIDAIVIPDENMRRVSPYEYYRKRFGYKVNKVPPGRLAGSVSHNALRIARTEINQTYRLSTVRMHDGQPWLKAFRWLLSRAHPKRDICDDYHNKLFKSEADLPYTHPHCMCDVVPEFYPIDQALKRAKDFDV